MSRVLAFLTLVGAIAACNAPQAFYKSLNDVPQPDSLTRTSYAVGDTLVLTGKLGGPHGGLQVTVGGVVAPVVAWTEQTPTGPGTPGVSQNTTTDAASIVITQAMGIGPNRLVAVTLGSVERNVGFIYISLVPPVPVLADTLNYSDFPISYTPYSQGGDTIMARGDTRDGRLYFLAGDTLVVWQNGVFTVLTTSLSDQYGPFQITGSSGAYNAYAQIDAAGQYLYASVFSSDTVAASANVPIFRLIKIDLHSFAVQTLNRTVYANQSVSSIEQALTGPVGTVFLPIVSQVFPAGDGTIYFVADWILPQQVTSATWTTVLGTNCTNRPDVVFPAAVGKIDPTGNVTYLIKSVCGFDFGGQGDLLPTLNRTHAWSWVDVIDPDAGVAYASGEGTTPAGLHVPNSGAHFAYDLSVQRLIGTFAPTYVPSGTTNPSGPFATVNGTFGALGLVEGGGHRLWVQQGQLPIPLTELEIADFDASTVSPYAVALNFLPPNSSLNGVQFLLAIVNFTPDGIPLVAAQGPFPGNLINTAQTSSAGAQMARRGVRPFPGHR